MKIVRTNIDHNIDETEFKHLIAIIASLIKYEGKDYISKLNALNQEYELKNTKFLSEKEYALKAVK